MNAVTMPNVNEVKEANGETPIDIPCLQKLDSPTGRIHTTYYGYWINPKVNLRFYSSPDEQKENEKT